MELSYEDLAPLVYIHNRFYGIDREHKYHHVVIDEAQDFSPFLLQDHCPSQSFTILGDILQNIYAFQGIDQ
jgi:DNA helicase-2/ATP-dependent DNA helicase PcrA